MNIFPERELNHAYGCQFSLLYLLLTDEQLSEIGAINGEDMVRWAANLRKDLAKSRLFFPILKEQSRHMLPYTTSGYATNSLPLLIDMRTYLTYAQRAKVLVEEYKAGREIDLQGEVFFIQAQLKQEGLPERLWPRFEDLLASTELELKMEAMCRPSKED